MTFWWQDNYLRMAMERYVKALSRDSDCHAAAMGVGMVFARRGKPEIVPWHDGTVWTLRKMLFSWLFDSLRTW